MRSFPAIAPRPARLRRTANKPGSKRRMIIGRAQRFIATLRALTATIFHQLIFWGCVCPPTDIAIASMLRNAWIALLALESRKIAMHGFRWPKTGSGSL